MCIFQSEQVTKLIKCPGFIGKNEWPPNSPVQNSLDYNVWGGVQCRDAVRNSRQNRPTLPSWRQSCYRYGMICHRSSYGNPIISKETWFSCVAAAGGHFEHYVQIKYWEGSWHSSLKCWNYWRKKVQKFDSSLLNRTRLRVHLKSELWSLNCCIYWTT